jgi:hypothetical protein
VPLHRARLVREREAGGELAQQREQPQVRPHPCGEPVRRHRARSAAGSGARRIAPATSRAGVVTTISGPSSWAARYSRKSANVRGSNVGHTPNTRATMPISRE